MRWISQHFNISELQLFEGYSVEGVLSSEWLVALSVWYSVQDCCGKALPLRVTIFISKWAWAGWESYLSMGHWPSRRASQETMLPMLLPSVCSFSFCSKLPKWWTVTWLKNHSQQMIITWDVFAQSIPSQQQSNNLEQKPEKKKMHKRIINMGFCY